MGTQPSGKWLKCAERLLEELESECFARRLRRWLPLVAERRTDVRGRESHGDPEAELLLADGNADCLKGIAWCCVRVDEPSLPGLLGDLAESCYLKVAWRGPRCAKVANAAVFALGQSPCSEAAAQLSRLRARVASPSAQKPIERALEAAAARAGLTALDLEEMAVPTFGLDAAGSARTQIGRFTADVRLEGMRDARLSWCDAAGKPQKSVPAEVKRDHPDEVRALQQTVKELQKLLPAQRNRVERLLITNREWPLEAWRERYVRHPVLAPLAQRLIWHFQDGERSALAIPCGGEPVDLQDRPLDWLSEATRVRLWHPAGCDPETVLRWRTWIEEHAVTQPFKQAHREIYLLTDAELRTRTYSNRFAAHVLKQHQFKALCDQRGWSYRLQGCYDSIVEPAAVRPVPQWYLSAEFWVEGVYGDDDTFSGPGVCLYVTTDQVRFVRDGAALLLAEVPRWPLRR